MARIIGGLATSHIPAIGGAIAKGAKAVTGKSGPSGAVSPSKQALEPTDPS